MSNDRYKPAIRRTDYCIVHWLLLAETVNSPISIADVQNFNGFDEAKVANGHNTTFKDFRVWRQ